MGAMTAPGGAAAVKGGLNNRTVLIGLIAVAAVVVIAIIVGVVTCSGGGKAPNLNGLVGDKAEQVAGTVDKLAKGSQNGQTFYAANEDMRDLIKRVNKAISSDKKDVKEIKDDIKKVNPWCIGMRDDDGKSLDAKDIKNGDDPSTASYLTYRVMEKPKSEDFAKIASEVCNFDKVIVCYDDKNEYYTGMARNNDVVITINAKETDGVYAVSVTCSRLDELENSEPLEEYFDSLYDDYADKDYEDVYRK